MIGGYADVYGYVNAKTGESFGKDQGGPLTDKKIIDEFEKSDRAVKKRMVKAAISRILTRAPMSRARAQFFFHRHVRACQRQNISACSVPKDSESLVPFHPCGAFYQAPTTFVFFLLFFF